MLCGIRARPVRGPGSGPKRNRKRPQGCVPTPSRGTPPRSEPGRPEAHTRFKEINAAYQILSDDQKRARVRPIRTVRVRTRRSGGRFGLRRHEVSRPRRALRGSARSVRNSHGRSGRYPREAIDRLRRVRARLHEGDHLHAARHAAIAAKAGGGEPGSRVERCGACGGRGRVALSTGGLAARDRTSLLGLPGPRVDSVPRAASACAGAGSSRRRERSR